MALLATLGGLIVLFCVAEATGWRVLAEPVRQVLASALQRRVELTAAAPARRASTGATTLPPPAAWRLQLLGSPRLSISRLDIGQPNGLDERTGAATDFLSVRDLEVQLRWADLWRGLRGQPWVIDQVRIDTLQLSAQRLADGRASWQLPAPRSGTASHPAPALRLRRLDLADGQLALDDALLRVQARGTLQARSSGRVAATLNAQGRYREAPLLLQLQAGDAISGPADQTASINPEAALPLRLTLRTRDVRLDAQGQIDEPLGRRTIDLGYVLAGPSLAEIGAPLGVNLPRTPPLRLQGRLRQAGPRWITDVAEARIGSSRLAGHFEFQPAIGGAVPRLDGQLRGSSLRLQDLGPAVGSQAGAAEADPKLPAPPPGGARLLPDRALDLPSLAAMDADVTIDLDRVDLGHPRLQDIQPLRGRLRVDAGRLSLDELQARLAAGELSGQLVVDARQALPQWHASLKVQGVKLEDWISQPRSGGQPPYVSGRVTAGLTLDGTGRSTAAVLGQASGRLWAAWTQGHISHLAVEAAGLDVAQTLGVWTKGDNALPVQCAALDARIDAGRIHPTRPPALLLVDTADSLLWVQGDASLQQESLDLTLRSQPKDFSPLSLRSPVHLRGTLAAPQVQFDRRSLALRALPAALLSSITPLAALLPLLDTGGADAADVAATLRSCQSVLTRHGPAPGPAPADS